MYVKGGRDVSQDLHYLGREYLLINPLMHYNLKKTIKI